MKFILIFAALFAAASAINPTALYRSRCSEGEAYWCESPTQAKACDAVDYCIEMHWRGKPIQGVVCDSCLAFVNGVHNVLESTTIQSEIISGAKLACSVMGPAAIGCRLLVDMYGPDLLKKLVSELTGQEVCDLMGLCTKKATGPLQVLPVAVNEVQTKDDDEFCDLCKELFGEIESIISNTTIQQTVENDILELCPLIENFVPNCTTLVKTYFPLIVAFLMENLNPDMVCKEIGLCPGMGGLKELLQRFKDLKNRAGDDLCTDCKTAFTDLDSMLTSAAIQEAVILELDQLCYTLGAYATGCKTLVDTYTKTVMDSIAAALAPDTVCSEIHFCPSTLPVSHKVSFARFARVMLGGDMCTDCKAFVGDIDAMLQNASFQQTIIKELDSLCDSFGSLATQCKSLVSQYAPLIFEFLPTILTPDTVCTDLGMCSSGKQLVQETRMVLSGDMCSDCKAFIGDINNMLKNETVQKMIETDLDNVCDLLGSFAAQCKTYVDQYAALVLDLLPTILTPDTVCTNIGMCSSGLVTVKKPVTDMNYCTVCQGVITAFDGAIGSTAAQGLIISGLDKVCTHFGTFAPMCKSLVDQYTKQILDFVVAHVVPKTVCTDIGLCPGASNAVKFLQKVHADPKTCTDCKAFFGDVDAMIMNATFQKEVIAELEMLCRDAGQYAAECKLLVDTYTGTALEYVAQLLDPSTICTDVGVCTSSVAVPKKLKFNADFCNDCKTFVTDIDSLLSDQTVQGDIISALEGVCDKFPSVAAQCKLLIETYGKTLINDLVTALNPTTVCTDLGICQSSESVVKSTNLQPAVSVQYTAMSLTRAQPVTNVQKAKPVTSTKADDPTPECLLCQTIVGYIDDLLKDNKTEEEILDAVADICDLLPATSQQTCKNDIHTYGFIIIQLLTQDFTPAQVCSTIGLCTSAAPSPKLTSLRDIKLFMSAAMPRADEFCSICKLFVTELDSILSSNKSKDEIVAEVEKLLCDNLPSPINDQCNAFMQIYGDVLVQLLIEQFNPDTFCVDVGLCTSLKKQPVKATRPVDSPVECALCEFVISELDSLIGKNSTEAEIKAALDKVCSLLPSTLKSECDDFINQYADMILKLLIDNLSPDQVCTSLGLCSSVKTPVKKTSPNVAISEQCILCEYIVHELDTLLEENSTEAQIEAALDKVCSLLPGTLKSECDQFIATYLPLLVSYLTQDLPPEMLCTALGFCQSNKTAVKASVKCTICEFVMSEVDELLGENKTQAAIEDALDKVCDILPATTKEECDDFVSTYTPILIELLQQQSPDAICTLLALCQSSQKAKLGGLECDLCQTTVRTIDDAIQEPEVTDAIVKIVNDTCAILPESIKTTCYSYVNMYGNLVTQFIAQYFDPITTCTLLDICPRPDNSPRKQLLGQHVCSRGPGYWCASQENAVQCNMVEHCKRHVWN